MQISCAWGDVLFRKLGALRLRSCFVNGRSYSARPDRVLFPPSATQAKSVDY